MDRETQLIDSLPGTLLRQWMNIWTGLIFHFPFSEAKGSVGSGNTSSSSQPSLHWCCHGHTVLKASSRGRVQSRTEESQVQSSLESLQSFQIIPKSRLSSVWKKMSYLIRFPILHLVTAASCPSLCLSEDGLALPALRSDWEVLPASSCTSCGSAFIFTLTALTDCIMARSVQYWGAQNWTQTADYPSEGGKGLFPCVGCTPTTTAQCAAGYLHCKGRWLH